MFKYTSNSAAVRFGLLVDRGVLSPNDVQWRWSNFPTFGSISLFRHADCNPSWLRSVLTGVVGGTLMLPIAILRMVVEPVVVALIIAFGRLFVGLWQALLWYGCVVIGGLFGFVGAIKVKNEAIDYALKCRADRNSVTGWLQTLTDMVNKQAEIKE